MLNTVNVHRDDVIPTFHDVKVLGNIPNVISLDYGMVLCLYSPYIYIFPIQLKSVGFRRDADHVETRYGHHFGYQVNRQR